MGSANDRFSNTRRIRFRVWGALGFNVLVVLGCVFDMLGLSVVVLVVAFVFLCFLAPLVFST